MDKLPGRMELKSEASWKHNKAESQYFVRGSFKPQIGALGSSSY